MNRLEAIGICLQSLDRFAEVNKMTTRLDFIIRNNLGEIQVRQQMGTTGPEGTTGTVGIKCSYDIAPPLPYAKILPKKGTL